MHAVTYLKAYFNILVLKPLIYKTLFLSIRLPLVTNMHIFPSIKHVKNVKHVLKKVKKCNILSRLPVFRIIQAHRRYS